jgi:hypothetical protein
MTNQKKKKKEDKDDIVTREMQTLEQIMDEKFPSDASVEWRGRGNRMVGSVHIQQHFCQH